MSAEADGSEKALDLMPQTEVGRAAPPPDLLSVAMPDLRARILADDIGADGAATPLDEAGDVVDLPTLPSGPADHSKISPHLLAGIVRDWRPVRAWVG